MGLINSDDIPRLSDCDYDLIREKAEQLRAVGKDVTATGSGVATTYRTLYNVYVAPEADQLVTSIDPVLSDSTEFGNTMTGVGGALRDFADEIEPINERLIELVGEASDLHYKITKCRLNGQAIHREMEAATNDDVLAGVLGLAVESGASAVNMATGKWEHTTKDFASAEYPEGAILVGTDWDGYTDLVGENNRINAEVRRLAPKFVEVQQRCANRIAILCGGDMWNLETGEPDGWELPPEVDEFGNEVKRIGAPPPPSWAEDAEWDRPLAMDVAAAPGELLLETLDFVTTLSGLQAALRTGLEGAGLGDTSFAQGLATWKESGEAWVNLAKTVGAIAGELASLNPVTDAGFKAVVGEETAQELHQFGVEWANGMVEDWKRNPAKAVLGVAVSVVPMGGALAALRVAGMASKIKPVAAVARGAQKLVDLKAAAIGKTLDTLRLPRVADIIGGKADIPLIETPQHIGIDPRDGRLDTSGGRAGVDRVEVPAVVGGRGDGLPGSHDRLGEQLPVTHERPVGRPVEQPVRTPQDRPGIDTTQRHPGTDDRPITSPADRPAARTGDREGQPVTPVTHPVGHIGDRTGTPTTHGERTGTPTAPGDRTGTSPGAGDRTGTSTGGRDRDGMAESRANERTPTTENRGRDRESTETEDRHDRAAESRDRAAAGRKRQEETEPAFAGRDHEGESQSPTRRDRDARSETPPPYVHASHTGGETTGRSRPGSSPPGRSGPARPDPDIRLADKWKREYDEEVDRFKPEYVKNVPGRSRTQVSPHTWVHPDPKDPGWGELVEAVGDDPLGNVERWASKVNPDYHMGVEYRINCPETARVFADILQGKQPVLAAGNRRRHAGGRPIDEMSDWMGVRSDGLFGSSWPHFDRPPSDKFVADSYDDVRRDLEGRPPGTVAIVKVMWHGGGAHTFNAFVDAKGRVRWADVQPQDREQVGSWPPRSYANRPNFLWFRVREPGGHWEEPSSPTVGVKPLGTTGSTTGHRPAAYAGGRAGTPTGHGDRTGTPTTHGWDTTTTGSRTSDRVPVEGRGRETSAGRDRQPETTTESRDRDPASADRRSERETQPVGRRDEHDYEETPGRDREPAATGRDPEDGSQSTTRRDRDRGVDTPPPYVHASQIGGGTTGRSDKDSSSHRRSEPDSEYRFGSGNPDLDLDLADEILDEFTPEYVKNVPGRSRPQVSPHTWVHPDPKDPRWGELVELVGDDPLGNVERWASRVNPYYHHGVEYQINCPETARVFADILQGKQPVLAAGNRRRHARGRSFHEMYDWMGVRWDGPVSSSWHRHDWPPSGRFVADAYDAVRRDLEGRPPGTVAIVNVTWDGGGGHGFNAFVDAKGVVRWADVQPQGRRQVGSWPPSYANLPTSLRFHVREPGGDWREPGSDRGGGATVGAKPSGRTGSTADRSAKHAGDYAGAPDTHHRDTDDGSQMQGRGRDVSDGEHRLAESRDRDPAATGRDHEGESQPTARRDGDAGSDSGYRFGPDNPDLDPDLRPDKADADKADADKADADKADARERPDPQRSPDEWKPEYEEVVEQLKPDYVKDRQRQPDVKTPEEWKPEFRTILNRLTPDYIRDRHRWDEAEDWKPEYEKDVDRFKPEYVKDVPGRPRTQVSPHTWIHPDPKDPGWGELVEAVGDDPLGNVERWASKVNPDYHMGVEYRINCPETARVFADILQGKQPVLAAGNRRRHARGRPVVEMFDWMGARPDGLFGSSWPHFDRPPSDKFVADSYDDVRRDLEGRPPGTVAIVTVRWHGGGAHAFNAFVDAKGRVRWADVQPQGRRQVGSWPPSYANRPTTLWFHVREPGGHWEDGSVGGAKPSGTTGSTTGHRPGPHAGDHAGMPATHRRETVDGSQMQGRGRDVSDGEDRLAESRDRDPAAIGRDHEGESQPTARRDGDAGTGSSGHRRGGPDGDSRPADERELPDPQRSPDEWKPEYEQILDKLRPEHARDIPGRPRYQVHPHTWMHPDPKDPKWGELVEAVGDDPLGNVERWASKVNPHYDKGVEYQQNCHDTSRAFADTLQGKQPMLAMGVRDKLGGTSGQMNNWVGIGPTWVRVWRKSEPPSDEFIADAFEDIRYTLEGRPPATVVIVRVAYSEGGGHAFNAFVDAKGTVKWADVQPQGRKQVGVWPPALTSRFRRLEFVVREPGQDWEAWEPRTGNDSPDGGEAGGRADDDAGLGSHQQGESEIGRRLGGAEPGDLGREQSSRGPAVGYRPGSIARVLDGGEPSRTAAAVDEGFDWFRRGDDPAGGSEHPPAGPEHGPGKLMSYRRNEVRWTTSEDGLPRTMRGTLREIYDKVPRSRGERDAQDEARSRGVPGDDGGHGVGHRFFPDQGPAGMFPQNRKFNVGAWLVLENEWDSWIRAGYEVRFEVTPFPPRTGRPDEIRVSYEVVDPNTGKTVWVNGRAFFNRSGQGFLRHPNGAIVRFDPPTTDVWAEPDAPAPASAVDSGRAPGAERTSTVPENNPDYSDPEYRASDRVLTEYRERHRITDSDLRVLAEIRRADGDTANLADEEILAIKRQMGMDHQETNEALRSGDGETLDRIDIEIRAAVSGLNKLPDYQGRVVRGIHVGAADMEAFLARYEPGSSVREPAFTSSDKDVPYSGNVEIYIESRTGKDISRLLDPHAGQRETVHPPGTRFDVDARIYNEETGKWEIYLSDRGR